MAKRTPNQLVIPAVSKATASARRAEREARRRRGGPTVRRVLQKAARQFRQMYRIVEYSVQSNHVHLVVEAADQRELSRGMQGFGIRLAKNLNVRLERRGRVLSDRYHARTLRTPTETLNALRSSTRAS